MAAKKQSDKPKEEKSKLPVSFSDFKKYPLHALLYLLLIAVSYLYIDNRVSTTKQIKYLMEQNEIKDKKIEELQTH